MIRHFIAIAIVLFLASCGTTKSYVADIDTTYKRIGKWEKDDAAMNKLIAPYKKQLGSVMDEVIAYTDFDMKKSQPNSTLGSWFVDAGADAAQQIYGGEIAFCLQNYGGIRVPGLSKGPITVVEIYEIMPFDNKLVILEMDAKKIQQLLDLIAGRGGWPVSDNLRFTISGDKATDILIGGKPLEEGKTYRVAIPDYIANGGDKAFFLKDCKREDKEMLVRDIIIDYHKQLPEDKKTISNNFSQRISK